MRRAFGIVVLPLFFLAATFMAAIEVMYGYDGGLGAYRAVWTDWKDCFWSRP